MINMKKDGQLFSYKFLDRFFYITVENLQMNLSKILFDQKMFLSTSVLVYHNWSNSLHYITCTLASDKDTLVANSSRTKASG